MPRVEEGQPCPKCGSTESTAVVFRFEETSALHVVCAPCHEREHEEFRDLQRQFEFLIRNGVSRSRANAIMIRRIDARR